MRILFGGMALVAGVLAMPGLVMAEDEKPAGGLFDRLDVNSDGQVTKDEVPEEKQQMFDRLLRAGDKDDNGQLSADEFAGSMDEARDRGFFGERFAQGSPPRERGEGRPDRPRRGRPDGPPRDGEDGPSRDRPDGPPGPPNPEEIFKRIDTDGDGSISKEEFVEHHKQIGERMRRFGSRPGGFVGPPDGDRPRRRPEGDGPEGRRGPGGPPRDGEDGPRGRGPEGRGPEGRGPGGRGPFGNPEEFFKRLDKNDDGKLTVDEAPEEGRERFERMMDRQDKDGDKAISKEEFMDAARTRRERGGEGRGRGPEGRGPGREGEGRRGRPEGGDRPAADDDVRFERERGGRFDSEEEYGPAFGRMFGLARFRFAAFANEKEEEVETKKSDDKKSEAKQGDKKSRHGKGHAKHAKRKHHGKQGSHARHGGHAKYGRYAHRGRPSRHGDHRHFAGRGGFGGPWGSFAMHRGPHGGRGGWGMHAGPQEGRGWGMYARHGRHGGHRASWQGRGPHGRGGWGQMAARGGHGKFHGYRGHFARHHGGPGGPKFARHHHLHRGSAFAHRGGMHRGGAMHRGPSFAGRGPGMYRDLGRPPGPPAFAAHRGSHRGPGFTGRLGGRPMGPAMAQFSPARVIARMTMALDSDKDGKVSGDEFTAGAKKRFEALDANKDGVVDAAEVRAAAKKMNERIENARKDFGKKARDKKDGKSSSKEEKKESTKEDQKTGEISPAVDVEVEQA